MFQIDESHEIKKIIFIISKIGFFLKLLPIFRGEKSNALLAFFLHHHQQPVHREKLLAKFWEYTDPESARNSLNVATHNIRRHFRDHLDGVDLLQYTNGTYLLNPALDVFTDTDPVSDQLEKRQARGTARRPGTSPAVLRYIERSSYATIISVSGTEPSINTTNVQKPCKKNWIFILLRRPGNSIRPSKPKRRSLPFSDLGALTCESNLAMVLFLFQFAGSDRVSFVPYWRNSGG